MTVSGENAVDEPSGPPRKKYRLCLSACAPQVRISHDNPTTLKGAMLNGYVPADSHNKSSAEDSPVSEGAGCSPVATLCNLGNTCFLNSVIYTLRFAPAFLHNLHHLVSDLGELTGRQQQAKAKSSSLGRNIGAGGKNWSSRDLLSLGSSSAGASDSAQGKSRIQVATERLHELYVALHASEIKENCDPFQPDVFLHALREVNPIFEGNQQHDAHELLVCLLDNIRETCRLLASQLEARQASEAAAAAAVATAAPSAAPDPPLDPLDALEPKMSGAATLPPPSKSWGVRTSWKKRKNTPAAALAKSCSSGAGNGLSNGVAMGVKDAPGTEAAAGPVLNGGAALHPALADIAEYSQAASPAAGPTEGAKCDVGTGSDTDKDAKKSTGYNFVADDFEGVAVLRTTCLECEHVTERKETFCDICVPILTDQDTDKGEGSGPLRVSEVYQAAIVTSENLRDLNKYWCEQCLRYNEACRSVRYETLPRLLVLQLKRFSSTFGSMVCMSKVNDYMPTPLRLACFCAHCCGLPEEQRPHQYHLYGVIMHLGATIASGHYVAYVKASENCLDYLHCSRDKLKAPGLSSSNSSSSSSGSSGSSGSKSSGGSGDKMSGILKFFRPRSNASGLDLLAKNAGNSGSSAGGLRNMCRSMDCCGVKLNSSLVSLHATNGVTESHRDPLGAGKVVNGAAASDAASPGAVWLECDDDTVRLLSTKEFEDVLAPKPSKNSALTPYLLFYAKE